MNIEELQAEAKWMLDYYNKPENEGKYIKQRKIVSKWLEITSKQELDFDRLAELVREAKINETEGTIQFFSFCGGIRKFYKQLWQEHLEKNLE